MKPRLESADWLHSDCDIARDVAFRLMDSWRMWPVILPYAYLMTESDRHDADLMFQAQKPASSPWCLGCIAGPFCCEQGKPYQCRLRVHGALRDVT